jgi:hypothetical protein
MIEKTIESLTKSILGNIDVYSKFHEIGRAPVDYVHILNDIIVELLFNI